MNIYTTAWDKGLKTTYYLHMKPRHSAEQSTTTVNKAQALGKKGFAVLRKDNTQNNTEEKELSVSSPEIINTPVLNLKKEILVSNEPKINIIEDPQEKFLCESCQ